MGNEQTFNDRALLEVISLIASRNESGRLKITDGTTRGAFFFREGKLVDAHMGPFSGFQAVNLAVSIGRARLSFDPTIPSHRYGFKIPSERIILNERFGIETAALEGTGENETESLAETQIPPQAATIPEVLPAQAKPAIETLPRETKPLVRDNDFVAKVLPSVPTLVLPSVPTLASDSPEVNQKSGGMRLALVSLSRRLLNDASPQQRVVALAVLLFFVIIPASVGLAYWNDNSANVKSLPAASTDQAGAEQPKGVTSLPVTADDNLTKPELIPEETTSPSRTSAVKSEVPLPSPVDTRLADAPNVNDTETTAASSLEPKTPQAEAQLEPSSRSIVVVLEIDEGRVTEAFVKNPQRGLSAYEATALRLARQRRFPKGTPRRETITLQVTGEP